MAAVAKLGPDTTVYCGPDAQHRMRQLVLLYTEMLATAEGIEYVDAAAAAEFFGAPVVSDGVPLDRPAAFRTAVALVRGATLDPPRYFFKESLSFFPVHCFHLPVLTLNALETALDGPVEMLNAALQAGFSTDLTTLFAFTVPRSTATAPLLTLRLRNVLRQCAFKSGSVLVPLLTHKVSSMLQASSAALKEPVKIFGVSFSQADLVARLCSLALLVCEQLDDTAVAQFCDEVSHVNKRSFESVQRHQDPAVMVATLEQLHRAFEVTWKRRPASIRGASSRNRQSDRRAIAVAELMQTIYTANYVDQSRGIVKPHEFYTKIVAEYTPQQVFDDFRVSIETESARSSGSLDVPFAFANFPCLLDVRYKSSLIHVESIVQHQIARERAVATAMFSPFGEAAALESNYLIMRVERSNLVRSTLDEIGRKSSKLRQPLRVTFIGEEGIDEGGVRKEFFQLIVKSLMDPNFGMFLPVANGTATWFQPWIRNSQNKPEFRLIGQVFGLAVNNNIILDVSFPHVVFRKLLGLVPDFEDLEEVDDGLAGGLAALLSFQEEGESTVEDTFCRMFTFEYDVFGQMTEVPLKEGGEAIALTSANRQEYIDLIVKHVLVDSIHENFEAFKAGFFSVIQRSIVPQMRPEELELLVCGQPTIQLEDLSDGVRYEGFKPEDACVQWFWDVLFDLNNDQKKLFLRFVTGSDRVPVGGLKELHFVIGLNGDDSSKLPTAHTCFNHLLLPRYASKELLREKLLLAIENCTGFGLR